MRAERQRRFRRKAAIIFGAIVIVVGVAIVIVNPRLTRYVESDAFRAELEKQTAKGLHFPAGTFSPVRRTGFLSAASAGFQAENGRKALTTMAAHGITARFNPLGVFLHDGSSTLCISMARKWESKPTSRSRSPLPANRGTTFFSRPDVYLRRVWSEPAHVTWKLRNEKGGFFGTRPLITPHGRDFEHRATCGTMKGPLIPDLPLRHTHLLITKTLLTLYVLDLSAGAENDEFIHAEGTAGTREDKSVDFRIKFGKVPVREWLPKAGMLTSAAWLRAR